jgi:ribosomal protein S18 acetylase RimI-like enzyme
MALPQLAQHPRLSKSASMSNPATPRDAHATEAQAVIALWEACGLTRPWNDPQADFAQALAGPSSTILVLRDEAGEAGQGDLAGSVMVGFDGHRGWVYYLAVAPARQRSGLGRVLMAAAEAWLRARGAPKIQLMVRADNSAALGFYEALGLERQPVVTLGRFLKDQEK